MKPVIKKINHMQKNISKQQNAYNIIKAKIIKNELKPDSVLVERQLSEELGISRTPIREALRTLSSEGFIDFIPDKGMFVSEIKFEDMMEMFEIREALEGMAIKLFVQRKDADTIRQMEEALSAQKRAYSDENFTLAREKDIEFHQLYIKGSKNIRLQNILKTIMDQNTRMTFYTAPSRSRTEDSLVQHRKVLQAIEEGNADLAERLIKKHIIDIKKYHISKHYMVQD